MANTKTKTVYKIKWKNLFVLLLIFFVIVGGCLLGYIGYFTVTDYIKTKEIIEKISSTIEVKNVVDDEYTKTIKPDSTLSKFDAYWDYIKLGLIEVDMAKLKRINTESVGYIEIKGTNFSYPVVKGENEFYKKHSLDKSENSFGWIYMDEENDESELDQNTIIYGNKNYLGILASSLSEVYKDEWKSDDDNYLIKFYTNDHSTLWQIISVYKTDSKEHLQRNFQSEDETKSYIENMLKKTNIKFKGYAKTDDKFLTITTNSSSSNIVIQAKMIKIKSHE